MQDIQILDCTLRDGGYVNNWKFGKDTIKQIIDSLSLSSIDFIEKGFLSNSDDSYSSEYSLYNNLGEIEPIYSSQKNMFTLMLNINDYNLNDLSSVKHPMEIRVAFKKFDLYDLKNYLEPLKKLNIPFSLNPMHISLYTVPELESLIDIANELHPVTFTLVDTMGIMKPADVKRILTVTDGMLDRNISIGCHFHDNLHNAFDNIVTMFNLNLNRKIIVDSCLTGISRGGGIIPTETLAEFLNNNYGKNYNTEHLNILVNNVISEIKKTYEKNDKKIYYISALNKCHPNYAKYLDDKGYSQEAIMQILSKIPDENKPYYSEKILRKLLSGSAYAAGLGSKKMFYCKIL